jgi:UDP-glucose 4-epimerase
MKILVTGGAGFIGSHLVDKLIKLNNKVVVVDDLSFGKQENINKKAIFYKLDICDKEGLTNVFEKEKPTIVFHLAAQASVGGSVKNPTKDAQINILGSINLLDCCVKYSVKKIIYSGSCAIYGNPIKLPIQENHPFQPLSQYAISKKAIEDYIQVYSKLYGLNYTILRYANVYGPRQNSSMEGGVIAIFIEKVLKDLPITINGDGTQTRDFIYVKEVIDVNLWAIKKGDMHIFNVGTGIKTQLNELIKELSKILKKPIKTIHGPDREGDIKHSVLDISALKKQGFEFRYDLFKGLISTIDFFKKSF